MIIAYQFWYKSDWKHYKDTPYNFFPYQFSLLIFVNIFLHVFIQVGEEVAGDRESCFNALKTHVWTILQVNRFIGDEWEYRDGYEGCILERLSCLQAWMGKGSPLFEICDFMKEITTSAQEHFETLYHKHSLFANNCKLQHPNFFGDVVVLCRSALGGWLRLTLGSTKKNMQQIQVKANYLRNTSPFNNLWLSLVTNFIFVGFAITQEAWDWLPRNNIFKRL